MENLLPTRDGNRPHVSISQIKTFVSCPLNYFFSYVLGIKAPPTGALMRGKVIHEAIEYDLKEKIRTGHNAKTSVVLDYYSDMFMNSKDNVRWHAEENVTEIYDSGTEVLAKYHREVAPTIQPLEVEHEFTVPFTNVDYDLVGVIDLIEKTKTITDHKVTTRKPQADAIDSDIQLTAYALAYKLRYGQLPEALRLNFLLPGKKAEIAEVVTKRTDQDIAAFLKNVSYVVKAINSRIWWSTVASSNMWVLRPRWNFYAEAGLFEEFMEKGEQHMIEKYAEGRWKETLKDKLTH